jgi:CubicO group peptidase (beta-lactamase class C family)
LNPRSKCLGSLLTAATFAANRLMIRNGVQAMLICNGLFTSHRTLDQVYEQELAYLGDRVLPRNSKHYSIDEKRRLVRVGGADSGIMIRAVFRPGFGCIVMAPDQLEEDIDLLPLRQPNPVGMDPGQIDWPDGDRLPTEKRAGQINAAALASAAHWAFNRPSPEQDTLSLLVVHRGDLVFERYAPGVDMHTRTRTWSTAKSIAVTLIGMLVDAEQLTLDEPLAIDWLPKLDSQAADLRSTITLRHLLQMSSGLYPVDSFGMEYATGSGLAYWAGASSSIGARRRGLVREPGYYWDYENYDTLLAVYAMKQALGDEKRYHQFPYRALLEPIGMRNTLLGVDRFGDFILSSQIYSNARDLARFGLLYLQNGKWNGRQLISRAWIDFVRSPAPATQERGNMYGAQWWLVPDDRTDVPGDAYSTAGNRGQFVIVVPSQELVIVRRGLDYGKQGFDRWDLTREVLKAFR